MDLSGWQIAATFWTTVLGLMAIAYIIGVHIFVFEPRNRVISKQIWTEDNHLRLREANNQRFSLQCSFDLNNHGLVIRLVGKTFQWVTVDNAGRTLNITCPANTEHMQWWLEKQPETRLGFVRPKTLEQQLFRENAYITMSLITRKLKQKKYNSPRLKGAATF